MGTAPGDREWHTLSLREISLIMATTKRKHNYEPLYEAHLGPLRQHPIKLLEIGVMKGASIAMWERYFPNARIYAIDISPKCKRFESDRSRIFIGDQADRYFLRATVREIGDALDVIIDDGGHTMEQQRVSFDTLFEYVKPNGFYIVEDIHTSYKEKHGGGEPGKEGTFISFLKRLTGNRRTFSENDSSPSPRSWLTELIDDVHFWSIRKHGRMERYHVSELHVYRNICFIRKADAASRTKKRGGML